jgi:hypothetical protein
MKTKLKAFLIATTAVGALAGGVLAQTPPPARTAPLAPAQPAFDLSQLPATRGTVKYFTLTPRGDVDGFILADGTQVHVPPHLSTQLVAAVRLGDAVTVRGLRAAAVPMVAALSVTGDASGQTVVDAGPPGGPGHGPGERADRGPGAPPPPPPGRPAAGPPSEVSGKILAVLHGPRGEANGAMLEDGTVLRLPPPEAARLTATLASGQTVVAQGPGIANNLGRMVDVRAIGPSRDQLAQVQAPPPPPGPGGERHGPGHGPGGPDGDRRGPPPPPGGPDAPPVPASRP